MTNFISLSLLVLLLHPPVSFMFDLWSATCDEQDICAVRGAEVTLRCIYSNINYKTGFWFSEKQSETWRKKEEPEDLMLDLDYAGRVSQLITNNQSELTITDLRETDSGEYQLMFIMKNGVKHLGSLAVNLTVTVLQVQINNYLTKTILTCNIHCIPDSELLHIYWTKNDQYIPDSDFKAIMVSFGEFYFFTYSCFVTGVRTASDPVCLSNRCWSVIYPSRRICALVGSTVDIHSTYSHPTGYTVEETLWHYSDTEEFIDLREEQQFAGRVEYVGNTLRIKDVKMSDSGEYRFRIISNTSDGNFSGLPGVVLTVTDTQVSSSPFAHSGKDNVILSCTTKCTLGKNLSYYWYKNGQLVTDEFTLLNKLYLDSVSSEEIEEYSCAVGEPVGSSALGQYTVTLLVFLPQMLIIAAVWMWFFLLKKRSALSKDQVDR